MPAAYTSERDIPEEIKALLDRGKTQKDLARDWGISQAYLSDVINGRRGAGTAILNNLGYESTRYYRKLVKSSVKGVKSCLASPSRTGKAT